MTAKQLRSKISRYFSKCRSEEASPTPAGLALALGMRTAELTSAPMDDECRQLIDNALQRIEVGTLDMLLNKSAARGLEIILQYTARNATPDRMNGLSDDQLDEQLLRMARRIGILSGRNEKEDDI